MSTRAVVTATGGAAGSARRSELLPRLQLLMAALLFSTGGTAVKATGLSAWQVSGGRSALAVVVLLLGLAWQGRRLPRARWRTWLVALAYAVTLTLFVSANKLTTAASAIFLQSTAPLYVLLLAPWLLREPARRRDLLFMAAIAGGLALFFVGLDPASASAPNPLAGNVLGAVAGLTWALTLLGLRWLARDGAAQQADLAAVVYGNLITALIALPRALPVGEVGGKDLAVLAFLGIFQVGLAYFFLMAGIRRVGALEASLLILVEPVASTFWAWLVHGEVPSPHSLTGAVLIVGATMTKTWLDTRRPALLPA